MLYQVVTPIIQPRMRFFDADGKPLVGGKVYSCYVGSDVFKPTYRDANKTALNTNPIVLDADGSALIYLNGAHVLKVYDRDGNLIESRYVPETQMRTQFFDKYGVPLKNGKVWTYDIASTIKKPSYANLDITQLNSNPVVLDAEGWASISMLGSYRLRSYNEKGVSTGDQDFRRPVAKALTSRVYPIYFKEGLAAGMSINNTSSRPDPALVGASAIDVENVGASLTINDVIIMHPTKIELIENVNVQIVVHDVISRQLAKINLNENVSTQLVMHDVVLRQRIKTNLNESVSTSLSINYVIREKI